MIDTNANEDNTVPSAPIQGAKSGGSAYWRSLDHVSDTPEFREYMHREFPKGASELMTDDRRTFLKVMGASFALAGIGLGGCRRWPVEEIAPYANRPEGRIPGEAEHYATAWEFAGRGVPMLAASMDGRPVKLEGHESFYGGGTDSFAQATLLDLYDIDRSRSVMQDGSASDWSNFDAFCSSDLSSVSGEKIALIAPSMSGPSAKAAKDAFLAKFPGARWVTFEPVCMDHLVKATTAVFGAPMRPDHKWNEADCVLVLDGDPIGTDADATGNARGWAAKRTPDSHGHMSRVYTFESILSVTGANADERHAVAPTDFPALAAAFEAGLSGNAVKAPGGLSEAVAHAVEDLKAAGKHALVVAGLDADPAVQAAACRMNAALGAIGTTAFWRPLNDAPLASAMQTFLSEAEAGAFEAVIVLDANPVNDVEGFDTAYAKAAHRIHLGAHENETGMASTWHLPAAHWLEAWNDVTNGDGSISIAQPLVMPLFGGRNTIEVLSALAGNFAPARSQVEANFSGGTSAWRTALHDGLIEGSATSPVSPSLTGGAVAPLLTSNEGWTLRFTPSPTLWDGRFANNGWLQELPDPITKLTWDNAVLMSPKSARELGVGDGDMVNISVDGKSVEAAVLRAPGMADKMVQLSLGGGRGFNGRICSEAGFRFESLRDLASPWMRSGAKIAKASGTYPLATTQDHHAIDVDTRGHMGIAERLPTIFREADLNEFKKDPGFAKHRTHVVHRISQWEENTLENGRYRWAMAIDLNKCTGCSACIVACQSENNIPVVGKDQVLRGREMHWLRLDRYYAFNESDGQIDGDQLEKVALQPVTCMQCENAPCEQVCPVAATVHDEEGLNAMVYNRCIGTRYCSNNCPYKVRRFNYFDYHNRDPLREGGILKVQRDYYQPGKQATPDDLKRLQLNPEVTVRMRGVMEKCTYCTQRITAERIKAKNAWAKAGGRDGGGQLELPNGDAAVPIADGTIVPACGQACSTDAIVFGDLRDENSRVAKLFRNERTYQMLEELHVNARTQYVAKVRNPYGGGSEGDGHGHHGHHGHDHGDHSDHSDHGHEDHADHDGHDHHEHGTEGHGDH